VTSRRILIGLVLVVIAVVLVAGVVFGCGHYGEPNDLLPPK
jgi:uncharacterized membrane protein